MSACDQLPTLSVPIFPFDQHSRFAKSWDSKHNEYPLVHLSEQIATVSKGTPGMPNAAPSLRRSSILLHSDTDDNRPSNLGISSCPSSTSSDASVNMEHPSKQTKVTLPPLSSLTSSIALDRRHDPPAIRERDADSRSTALSSRGVMMKETMHGSDNVPERPYMSHEHRWPTNHSNARTTHPKTSVLSPPDRKVTDVASKSASLSLRDQPTAPAESPRQSVTSLRDAIESTRPRSYSSPHRVRMHNPTRRSSLADVSEVDRLLEGLIYVQDINRRLGLHCGGPASPSVFQSSGAAQLLRNKIREELNTMSLFSHTRAESVAMQLALPASLVPNRRTSEEAATQQGRVSMPRISSGQAGHSLRPPSDTAEREQSSMGYPSLEERHPRDFDHAYHSEASVDKFESAHGAYYARDASSFVSHQVHPDQTYRIISRAISFEQPRSEHQRYRHSQYLENGPTDLNRFEMDARVQNDHGIRHALGTNSLPPMYTPEGRHQQQMELFDRRRLAGKGMKRVRKRKNEHHQECLGCQAKETPEWRKGPMGPRTLCNACGLLYAKLTKRKQQQAEAAAKASGKTAEEIVREREESPGAKQASLEALRAELNLANGMRNRVTPSSTSFCNVDTLQAHHPASRMHSGHVYDDIPPSSQPWPAQIRESFQPFAHQAPPTRSIVSNPGRSNSIGHVESFENLIGRPANMGQVRTQSRQGPMRPYSGSGSPGTRPSPLPIGRQRSASTLHAPAVPPYAPHYDRPASPSAPASQGYGPSALNSQRRHHPYM